MRAFARWLWNLLPANPLLIRILAASSRRTHQLWIRMGYLGALLLSVLLSLLAAGSLNDASLTSLAKTGTWLFAIISYSQVILICLLAPFFLAGAITQEQSAQTLDILLTTPLSSLQIVLGSLLGRLALILLLLLSGLPLFSLLLIFGGVPLRSVFAALAIAALTALFFGALAIALAVLRADERKTIHIYVLIAVLHLAGLYAADHLLRRLPTLSSPSQRPSPLSSPGQTTFLTPLHPLLVLESFLNSANYHPPPPEDLTAYPTLVRIYLGQPLLSFTLLSLFSSLLLIFWAAWNLRRLTYLQGAPSLWKRWFRTLIHASPSAAFPRPRPVWQNPIAWREVHRRATASARLIRLAFPLIALAATLSLLFLYHTGQPAPLTGQPLAPEHLQQALLILLWIQLIILTLLTLYLSASSIARERQERTFDLLVSTPITPQQYLGGKLHGLGRFLLPFLAGPILTSLTLSLYMLLGLAHDWPQIHPTLLVPTARGLATAKNPLLLPEISLLLPPLLLSFTALTATAGLQASLRARTVFSAVGTTLGLFLVLLLFLSACGTAASANIPLIGPALNAASPLTSLTMLITPCQSVAGFVDSPLLSRLTMASAVLAASTLYSFLAYSLFQGTVHSFDQAVRHLTGQET